MAQLNGQALPAGSQIGVYEIKDVISSDWSGILYHAWNEHLNAMVALKEYLPSDHAVRGEDGVSVKAKSSEDASIFEYGMEKFLELAIILTDIQQPNVVSVHNVLQFNDTAYLAMDFEDGTPLSAIQDATNSFTEAESKQTLVSLLHALQAVHDKTIVHGNINPSKIIIRENGNPVLVDFASANIALAEHCKQTGQATYPDYISNKSYQPDDVHNPSSDFYSLGASIFFCITGCEPALISDRQGALKNNNPDPCQTALEKVESELSEELKKTILWLMNPDPVQRPHSAHDVLETLGQVSAENDREEGALQTLSKEKSDSSMLLSGIAVLIILIVGVFWYLIKQTPETTAINEAKTSDVGENFRETVAEEGKNEDFTLEQSPENLQVAANALEFVEQKSEKTEQNIVATTAIQSSVESVEINDTKGQAKEKLDDNLVTAKSEILNQQETDIEESVPENIQPLSTEESTASKSELEFESEEEKIPGKHENVEIQSTDEQEEKINQLLDAAKENLDKFNLTTPPEDNALSQYQAVLNIDPDNVHANVGLELILEKYIGMTEKAITEERFNEATVYLRRMEAVKSDSLDILRLRNELKEKKQQWEYLHQEQSYISQNSY